MITKKPSGEFEMTNFECTHCNGSGHIRCGSLSREINTCVACNGSGLKPWAVEVISALSTHVSPSIPTLTGSTAE